MQEKKEVVVHARVSGDLKKAVKSAVEHCGYLNESEFFREAVREKIRRDMGLDDFLIRNTRAKQECIVSMHPQGR